MKTVIEWYCESAMITIRTTPEDLVKLRFGYRPLLEIPLSYRVLINPNFQTSYHRWVDETQRTLYDVDLPYLKALVPPRGYIPDFLTPTPNGKRTDIETDFQELLLTPDELVRDGILGLIAFDGNSPIRQHFLTFPRAALWCLVEELRIYWQRVLSHYWSRMMSALEGDMLYRARMLALDGPASLFGDLHSTIDFHDSRICIQPCCYYRDNGVEFSLNGEGIQLVPMVFKGCGRSYQVVEGWQPMLTYGMRGAGLWYQKAPTDNQSLELALGTGRAAVLRVLQMPASNGEVAFKAQITASTATQHLLRLTKAGLIRPQRSGKRVYYSLTERGENLLALFDTAD
jgi:DNA-binding transcriptional ArsR family regulator